MNTIHIIVDYISEFGTEHHFESTEVQNIILTQHGFKIEFTGYDGYIGFTHGQIIKMEIKTRDHT